MKAALFVPLVLIGLNSLVAVDVCRPYTEGVCKGLFDRDVAIPEDRTIQMMENSMEKYYSRFVGLSFIDPLCYQASLAFLCTTTYSPCSDTPVPLPTPPCQSMCTRANELCASHFSSLGFSFPCESFVAETVPTGFPRQCNVMDSKKIALPECPDTAKLARPPEGGACEIKCDYNYYTDNQDHVLYAAGIGISIASLVGAVVVCATWSIFPFKYTHPSNMVLYLAISSIGLCIGQLMKLIPIDEGFCKDVVTPADASVPACGVQGFLIHYFSLSMACWWLCISFNLHQMIVNKNTKTNQYQKFYHVFSWGFPALVCFIGLGVQTYVYTASSFKVCFFDTDARMDGLFLVWFLIFGGIGNGLIFHVSYKLYRSYMKMRGVSSVGHNVFKAQLRSYIFLAYYNIIVISLVSFLYYGRSVSEEGQNDLEQYFACMAASFESADKECSYQPAVGFDFLLYTVIIVFGQGLFLFFTFMTTEDSYMCWKLFLTTGRLDFDPRFSSLKSTTRSSGAYAAATGSEPASGSAKKPMTTKDLEMSSMQFATSEAKASLGVD
eukprot:TRINITY_DN1929_c0_g2_i1.p1 TRINITY_DN1929_c0_g2~~TRINITY_DN1929_c0_g2_i1.p1  ORF type:complete len:551 (-),score=96.04 TRINITY_DN1929_c0_g2_i1:87-1739(-)